MLIKNVLYVTLGFLLFCITDVSAAFQVYEQGAGTLGVASAGSGTNAQNASIEYFNAAGMTLIKHPIVSVSASQSFGRVRYQVKQATNNIGSTVNGNSSNPSANGVLPSLHYIQPINKYITAGFGITAPFGARLIYDNNSMARYFATKSYIETMNFNPNIAVALNKKLSLGMGLNMQKITVDLNKYAVLPTLEDIEVQNHASSWGLGLNLGMMYQMLPSTRMGLSYRSRVRHTLKGTTFFSENSVFPRSTPCSADFVLPDMYIFSIYHNVTKKWVVMSDIQYTSWSVLKVVNLANPNLHQITPLQLQFNNAWRISLGNFYRISSRWLIRGGVAFNKSPVTDKYRLPSLPDSDRLQIAMGANYVFNKYINVDIAYSHLFFKNCTVNQTSSTDASKFVADYSASANIIGLQMNVVFPDSDA